jgi:hypothetical protein
MVATWWAGAGMASLFSWRDIGGEMAAPELEKFKVNQGDPPLNRIPMAHRFRAHPSKKIVVLRGRLARPSSCAKMPIPTAPSDQP